MPESKDKNPSRKKRFLALPKYPGGSQAFKRFISDNLSYPEEALKNRIEGDVYITYRVSDNGNVTDAAVTKGMGYGCDEEALRLIHLLKYEPVRNRGVRLTSTMRTKIPFRLSKTQPQYQVVYQSSPPGEKGGPAKQEQQKGNTYSYTVHYEVNSTRQDN